VLRPTRTDVELALPDDDGPSTGTYAALDGSGTVVSSARVALSPLPPVLDPAPVAGTSWRLRGMATRAELRGQGIGSAVLERAIAHVAEHGGGLLWCNARIPALSLYLRAGFREAGDPWEDPEIGPHVVMWRAVDPLNPAAPSR
jgi:GNAT superfamily N-acetyltransferase